MTQTKSEPDYVPPFMVRVDSVSFPAPMGPFDDLKDALTLAAQCARRSGEDRVEILDSVGHTVG